jgi:hypothetical protein
VATATSGSREMAGMIRRPSAWIRRPRWPGFGGGRGGQQGGAKIRNVSRSSAWICTGLEEGFEPDHLDAVEMGGRPDLHRRRGWSPAAWTGWGGEGEARTHLLVQSGAR